MSRWVRIDNRQYQSWINLIERIQLNQTVKNNDKVRLESIKQSIKRAKEF